MAPKRAAQTEGKAVRAAKVARVAAVPKVESRFPAVDTLLAELGSVLPGHCREMLASMVPFAIETPAEQRHSFQQRVLEEMLAACAKESANRDGAVAELEGKIAALGGEREEAAARLTAAEAAEASRREAKEVAEASVASCSGAADAAAATVTEAQSAASEADAAVEAAVAAKAEFDGKVEELLKPLKEGSFPKKDWRARQKAISQLIHLFALTPAPESLTAALPLALKDGPDARSPFANRAVEEGEALLTARSAHLESEIEVARSGAAEKREVVASRQALAGEAAAARDAAIEDGIAKENEWLESSEALRSAKNCVDALPEEAERLGAALVEAKAAVERLTAAVRGVEQQLSTEAEPAPVDEPAEVKADEMPVEEPVVEQVALEMPQVLAN